MFFTKNEDEHVLGLEHHTVFISTYASAHLFTCTNVKLGSEVREPIATSLSVSRHATKIEINLSTDGFSNG